MTSPVAPARARTVVSGATGYLGRALAERLVARGHDVVAIVRPGATSRAPRCTQVVEADVLTANGVARALAPGDTLVHLIGTPRPSPAKGAQFRAVDLQSIVAATAAARQAPIAHLVYVSVAHPAPAMRDYIAVRQQGEALVAATGLPSTVLRPWYVLGPGHWWPYALVPLYGLARIVPSWRESAIRLGLVTWREMREALVWSVEHPPASGVRVLDVPAIRRAPRAEPDSRPPAT
jgi:uncharacterized protein YbjT (DUF2867 family)